MLVICIFSVTAPRDRLTMGMHLNAGEQLQSQNSIYWLVLQKDSNLVLYDQWNTALWASNTTSSLGGVTTLKLEASDGNLVMYNQHNETVWESGVYGSRWGTDIFAVMQDDGNFVVYNKQNKPMFSTDTYGGKQSDKWGRGKRHDY